MLYSKQFFFKPTTLPTCLWIIVLALQQYTQNAYGDCEYITDGGYVTNTTQYITFDIPKLTIARDTPIGTLVYTTSKKGMGPGAEIRCNGGESMGLTNQYAASGTADSNGIFRLGDTGLGYKLKDSRFDSLYQKYPTTAYLGRTIIGGFIPVTLNIYKVGEIKNGTVIKGGRFAKFDMSPVTPLSFALSEFSILSPTCEVEKIISVPMGKQKTTGFTGPNSRLPPVAFKIPLRNCPASQNGISFQLDPMTTAINNNTVATLDSTSTAKGVGIQVLMNSTPVKFGTQLPVTNATSSGSSFNIALEAAYIQTDSKVTTGSANTSLTFTLNYK